MTEQEWLKFNGLRRSPQAIDHANFAEILLMPAVVPPPPPAVVVTVSPAPAVMMTMTVAMAANLHDTRSIGSTKIAGTGNRHRGGRQGPSNDRANDNQTPFHFHPCSRFN
jgi:hypothetical protein